MRACSSIIIQYQPFCHNKSTKAIPLSVAAAAAANKHNCIHSIHALIHSECAKHSCVNEITATAIIMPFFTSLFCELAFVVCVFGVRCSLVSHFANNYMLFVYKHILIIISSLKWLGMWCKWVCVCVLHFSAGRFNGWEFPWIYGPICLGWVF